jgi:hypothetical protein
MVIDSSKDCSSFFGIIEGFFAALLGFTDQGIQYLIVFVSGHWYPTLKIRIEGSIAMNRVQSFLRLAARLPWLVTLFFSVFCLSGTGRADEFDLRRVPLPILHQVELEIQSLYESRDPGSTADWVEMPGVPRGPSPSALESRAVRRATGNFPVDFERWDSLTTPERHELLNEVRSEILGESIERFFDAIYSRRRERMQSHDSFSVEMTVLERELSRRRSRSLLRLYLIGDRDIIRHDSELQTLVSWYRVGNRLGHRAAHLQSSHQPRPVDTVAGFEDSIREENTRRLNLCLTQLRRVPEIEQYRWEGDDRELLRTTGNGVSHGQVMSIEEVCHSEHPAFYRARHRLNRFFEHSNGAQILDLISRLSSEAREADAIEVMGSVHRMLDRGRRLSGSPVHLQCVLDGLNSPGSCLAADDERARQMVIVYEQCLQIEAVDRDEEARADFCASQARFFPRGLTEWLARFRTPAYAACRQRVNNLEARTHYEAPSYYRSGCAADDVQTVVARPQLAHCLRVSRGSWDTCHYNAERMALNLQSRAARRCVTSLSEVADIVTPDLDSSMAHEDRDPVEPWHREALEACAENPDLVRWFRNSEMPQCLRIQARANGPVQVTKEGLARLASRCVSVREGR